MLKVFKVVGLMMFMLAGYFVGDFLIFDKIIDPLQLGPRPIIAAATTGIFVLLFASIGAVVLKVDEIL